jgi:hypothetical protein
MFFSYNPILTCQREYVEFKVMVNGLVAKAQKVPEEGWIVQDFTPWPGNNTRDHPGMIQVSIYKIKLLLLSCLLIWLIIVLPPFFS